MRTQIDELFRKELSQYEVRPSAAAFDKLRKQQQLKARRVLAAKIGAGFALLLVGAGFAWFWWQSSTTSQPETQQTISVADTAIVYRPARIHAYRVETTKQALPATAAKKHTTNVLTAHSLISWSVRSKAGTETQAAFGATHTAQVLETVYAADTTLLNESEALTPKSRTLTVKKPGIFGKKKKQRKMIVELNTTKPNNAAAPGKKKAGFKKVLQSVGEF